MIGAISLFIIAFSFGPGPLCYFISSEMVHQNARSAAQSWANLCQMIRYDFSFQLLHTSQLKIKNVGFSRAILLAVYLPLRNLIGNGEAYAMLFVISIFASLLFLYFRLPETKNRNLQQVHLEIAKLPKMTFVRGTKNPKIYVQNSSKKPRLASIPS